MKNVVGLDGKPIAGEKPITVLRRGAKSAILLQPRELGDIAIESAIQIVHPEPGGWMLVDAALWSSMTQRVFEADIILEASSKVGRVARKARDRIRTPRRLDA